METNTTVRWYANPYILLTILVSVLAVSFAALLLLLMFVLPWSSEIVRYMQGKMLGVTTGKVTVDFSYVGAAKITQAAGNVTTKPESLTWHSEDVFDRTLRSQPKSSGEFKLRINEQPSYLFEGRRTSVGATDHVNFDTLPETVGVLRLGQYRGLWLRVWRNSLRDFVNLPLVGSDHRPMSDLDEALIAERIRKTGFFAVEERLDDEGVNGARVHRYRVKPVDMVLFRDLYERVEAARLGRALNEKEQMASKTFFANLRISSAEMWIGATDHYLYRVRISGDYDSAARKGEYALDVQFSDLNRPQQPIDAPVESRDVTQVVASLLAGLQGHLPLAKDGAPPFSSVTQNSGGLPVSLGGLDDRDSDNDGLSDFLETFYGTDPASSDTDGDGRKDGEEVEAGCNPRGDGWIFDFGLTGGECK